MMTIGEIIETLSHYAPNDVFTLSYIDENRKEKFLTLEKIEPTNLLWAETAHNVVEFSKPNGQLIAWQGGVRIPANAERKKR